MSTLVAKPVRKKMLNPKLLAIAAVLLLVLALLFLATPLLPTNSGFQPSGSLMIQPGGQALPGGASGFPEDGTSPQIPVSPGQSGSGIPSQRVGGPGGLMGFGLLGGIGGTIVYAIALLVSLVAAVGMFMVKGWGKVLGIIMGVFYLLLSLVGFLPILLISFMGMRNSLNIVLGIVHLLLAVAVIVLAFIPGRKTAEAVPVAPTLPTG